MLFISHWSGCLQFFVPVIQGWPENSWIVLEKLQDASFWERYTAAIFRSFSHLISMGYGVNAPQTHSDTVFLLLSMLSGATFYALFVGYSTDLIQSFDISSKQFRSHLHKVKEYMSFRKLPLDLRDRVTNYYEKRFGRKLFDEELILQELSETLRTEIQNHNCKELIRSVPFFVQADPNFVNDVITNLKFEMYMPDDIIIKANTNADRMFFIQEGLVEILDDNGMPLTRLSGGSYFGEIALLSKKKRTATIRAVDLCNLFSLSREHFDSIITSYPMVRRFMETIAAQRMNIFGKDPTTVTSRASLVNDLNDIARVIRRSQELIHDNEVEEVNEEVIEELRTVTPPLSSKHLVFSAFKKFFSEDRESVGPTPRGSILPRSSPVPGSEDVNNSCSGLSRSDDKMSNSQKRNTHGLRLRSKSLSELQKDESINRLKFFSIIDSQCDDKHKKS